MTLLGARFVLMLVWTLGSTPAVFWVLLQTLHQGYGSGDGVDKGLLWILPAVMPQVATVLTSSFVQRNRRVAPAIVSPAVFWTLVLISALYIAIIYAVLLTGVLYFRNDNWDHLFRVSGWTLILIQFVFFSTYASVFADDR